MYWEYLINKKTDFLKIIFLLFCVSGYDLIFLNDENLLFNIFFFIIISLFLKFKDSLIKLNKSNKIYLIKEYYYKIYLIKIFYLNFINFLKYNFNVYNNYYKYYNSFSNLLKKLIIFFNKNIYSSYLKYFLNYLNTLFNLMKFKYIELKYSIILNFYYMLKILHFFKIKRIK